MIMGGPEVSVNAPEMLKVNLQMDFMIYGNGETRLKGLLRSGFDKKEVMQIPGITFRNESGEIVRHEGSIVEDLVAIPSAFKNKIINLDANKSNCVFIETYRGCIFECGYCYWMGEQKKKLNLWPIETILEDIELIYNHPNVSAVVFTDACLFYTRDRAKIILDKVASCSRKIPTILTLDISFINREAVECLKKLDLSHQKFLFGVQTINQETLKLMSRTKRPEHIRERINLLREMDPGAEISLDLIYGLPGDNFELFRNTINFSLEMSPIKLNMSPLVLLPGSPFWAQKVELGIDHLPTTPYYIRSNKTYSAEDMRKSRKFVLGIMMVMYFAAIRDTIYELCTIKPDLNRLDIFEEFIRIFQERSEIVFDYVGYTDDEQCSAEAQNEVRRKVMNQVADPKNCFLAYEIMIDLLRKYDAEDIGEKVLMGMEYYSQKGKTDAGHNSKRWDAIKIEWVIPKKAPLEYAGINKYLFEGGQES